MTDLALQPRLDLGDRPTGHAPLTNMSLLLSTLMDCRESENPSARMGLYYGPSGYGKTVAAGFAAARTGAIYVQAQRIWTQKTVLEAIAEELGIARLERSGPRIFRQVVDQLNLAPVDIIIDEMDYLADKGLVEFIRDIHDATRIAILMIGEEALPAKLKRWERFDNRILVASPAQPASAEDALQLRDHYCHRIRIDDDLAELFRVRCRGITRRIVNNLQAAQRAAAVEGVTEINGAWWGDRPIATGDVVVRRRDTA
jgi:type II secretory pathway predicted ATPase ExeA